LWECHGSLWWRKQALSLLEWNDRSFHELGGWQLVILRLLYVSDYGSVDLNLFLTWHTVRVQLDALYSMESEQLVAPDQ
jgi:hypothetical protein